MPRSSYKNRGRRGAHGSSTRGSGRWRSNRGRQGRGSLHQGGQHTRGRSTTRFTSQDRSERSTSTTSNVFRSTTPSQHTNVDNESEEYLDSLNEVVMAVDIRDRGAVGCAYYVAQTETLHFMEDVKFGNVEIIDSLKLFIHPTTIIVSSRLDDGVMELLDPQARNRRSNGGASDAYNLPYAIEARPTSEFNYETAKTKLVGLKLGSERGPRVTMVFPGDVSAEEPGFEDMNSPYEGYQSMLLKLAGWVNVDSRVTVGCSGALLAYIQRRRASQYMPGDQNAQIFLHIATLEMFSLQDTMFINSDTLLSLQIMQSESHPNMHNQGPIKANSGVKEGLSVFGLFYNLAGAPQGKNLLRQYFLRPSLSIPLIEQRLDTISIFLHPENELSINSIAKSLRSVTNVRALLISLRKGMTGGSGKAGAIAARTWTKLRRFCFAVGKIKEELFKVSNVQNTAIFAKAQRAFDTFQLEEIGIMINSIVDFEESQIQDRTIVRPNVDHQLDELKHRYAGIPDLLTKVAKEIARTVPQTDDIELNVVYFPQIGYLISMPINSDSGRASWEGDESSPWERIFCSDRVAYYKNERMNEMDEDLGDLWTNICDLETEIIFGLAQQILEFEELLAIASETCGQLDCLVALTRGAKRHQLVRPSIVADNVIRIENGRHPLQALTVPSFVPNGLNLYGGSTIDTESDLEEPSMLIMTGPNNSGKSVYLKQNAIIVYMAHVGCFVPAAKATIGITDKILTRIATRETVSRAQSAFMIDLQQTSIALHLATSRSLLIIDEFGKGTNASDGAGLACAVFDHLLKRGPTCPKVLAATHYHEIFEHRLLEERASLMLAHSEILIDSQAEETENQLTYLYSVKEGRSTRSFGTICAALNGIAPEVIGRADELALLAAQSEDLAAVCAVMPPEEEEQLEQAERVARRFLAEDIDIDPRRWLQATLAGHQETTVTSTYFS